jgi:hypothetical protein
MIWFDVALRQKAYSAPTWRFRFAPRMIVATSDGARRKRH